MKSYFSFMKRYPRQMLYAGGHGFVSSLGQTFLIALFVGQIKAEMGLSNTLFSSVYALATLASAGLLLITGPLIDRVNLRLYSLATMAGLAASCVLIAMSTSVYVLFFAILGLRHFGQGLMSHIMSVVCSRYFERSRGKALAVSSLGMSVAEALLPALVATMIVGMGWRGAYSTIGIVMVAVFATLSIFLVRKGDGLLTPHGRAPDDAHDATAPAAISESWHHRKVIRDPFFWLVIPLVCTPPFLLTGFFFFQSSLAAEKGWSMQLIGAAFAGYGVCRVIFSLLTGPIVDKFSAKACAPLSLLPMTLTLLVAGFLDQTWVAWVYMMGFGVSVAYSMNATNALWAEIYGTHHIGAIRSVVGMLMVLSTSLAPVIIGVLLDQGMPMYVMLLAGSAICAMATSVAWFATARYHNA